MGTRRPSSLTPCLGHRLGSRSLSIHVDLFPPVVDLLLIFSLRGVFTPYLFHSALVRLLTKVLFIPPPLRSGVAGSLARCPSFACFFPLLPALPVFCACVFFFTNRFPDPYRTEPNVPNPSFHTPGPTFNVEDVIFLSQFFDPAVMRYFATKPPDRLPVSCFISRKHPTVVFICSPRGSALPSVVSLFPSLTFFVILRLRDRSSLPLGP